MYGFLFHTFHFAFLWDRDGSLEMASYVESHHSTPTDVPAVFLWICIQHYSNSCIFSNVLETSLYLLNHASKPFQEALL